MSDGSPVRRSFRLKNKPEPDYVYENFLRKDYLPPAVVRVNKKYDDIFSSVVTNAFLLDIQKTPDQYYAEKEAAAALKRSLAVPDASDSDSDVIILDDSSSDDVGPSEVSRKGKTPKKIRKMLEQIEKNRKISAQRTVKKLEKIVAKIESGVKKIEENTKKMRNSSSTSSMSSDLEILEETTSISVGKFGCSCGKVLRGHEECHRHIFEEHIHHQECIHCGQGRDEILTTNGCHVCSKYAPDLEQHLSQHYRNCTGKNAIMECRYCTKQFQTVKEVVAHEKEKHLGRPAVRKVPTHKCNECPFECDNQEIIIQHYGKFHVDLNALGDKINELQDKVNAPKEECPFCRTNMASRKGFRAHLLRSHWLACKSLSRMEIIDFQTEPTAQSDLEIKKEIDELLEATGAQMMAPEPQKGAEPARITVKMEIKEEMHDFDGDYGQGPSTSGF